MDPTEGQPCVHNNEVDLALLGLWKRSTSSMATRKEVDLLLVTVHKVDLVHGSEDWDYINIGLVGKVDLLHGPDNDVYLLHRLNDDVDLFVGPDDDLDFIVGPVDEGDIV